LLKIHLVHASAAGCVLDEAQTAHFKFESTNMESKFEFALIWGWAMLYHHVSHDMLPMLHPLRQRELRKTFPQLSFPHTPTPSTASLRQTMI
jgi:hypothetical protein